MAKKKKTKRKDNYQKVIAQLPYSWEELRRHRHKETSGADGVNISSYSADYIDNLKSLAEELSNNTFTFQSLKRATVEKGREILIQNVNERIVSKALLKIVAPYFDKLNSNLDFSRRVRRSHHIKEDIPFDGIPLAVKMIQSHLNEGYVWILEADIKKFFDNVPKDKIWNLVTSRIRNKKVQGLINQTIYFSATTSNKTDAKTYDKFKGIAQGLPLSPILASIYLYEFDMYVSNTPNIRLVRYVDDFIVLCKDEKTARIMYDVVTEKLKEMEVEIYKLGEPSGNSGKEKTKITLAKGFGAASFDFLGLRFNNTDVDISPEKKENINKKILEIIHAGGPNFLQKTKSIESRLNGYIDHYRKGHYTRTVPSLNKIIKFSQDELRNYYIKVYKEITGREPFKKLTPDMVETLFKFMGINFTHLIEKTNKPISLKKK